MTTIWALFSLSALLLFGVRQTSGQWSPVGGDRGLLELQLNKLLQHSLEPEQRAEPEMRQLVAQLASHTAQLFDTLPRGSGGPSSALGERRRRLVAWSPPRHSNMDNTLGLLELSLLEPGETGSSRSGRAYKPRIMSTARGFGKR